MGTQVNMGNQQVVGPQFGGSTIAGARASGTQGFNAPTESQSSEPVEIGPSVLDQIVEDNIQQESQRFEYALKVGEAAARSKYFSDAETVTQAAMKIMAGHELGLAPIASMMGINIIKGRVSLSGELIGALMQKAGFTWRFGKHDENGCELWCYQNGRPMLNHDGSQSSVVFSRKDADRAGLTEKQGDKKDKPSMYDKYGMDMYFNRAIARFQRRFAPGVTKGVPILTPDEVDEIVTQSAPGQMPRRAESITGESPATGTEKRNDA